MNMRKVPLLLAVALMMALAGSALALVGSSETVESTNLLAMPSLTVCASGCDHTSIQDAIDAATSGDRIDIQAGTYFENLTIDKDITLQGADQATTIIDGQAQGTVVTIFSNPTVIIADVTITNGLGNNQGSGPDDGGGIFNEGSLTVLRSTIRDNDADVGGGGGGIWNGGMLTVTESTISHNVGNDGGGILNQSSTLTLNNSTVSDNIAFENGGGVLNFQGTAELINSTVSGNSGEGQGGGIWSQELNGVGSLTLENSIVSATALAKGAESTIIAVP